MPSIDPNGVSQLHDLSPTIDKYLQAFWFALGVMLAPSYTPEIMPATRLEVAFVSVLIIIGTVMFAIVIGTVSTLLVSKKLLESKVERQLAELREFLQEKNIPKEIRQLCLSECALLKNVAPVGTVFGTRSKRK